MPRLLAILFAACTIAGCSSIGGNAVDYKDLPTLPDQTWTYTLRSDDYLRITVANDPTFVHEVRIAPDGEVDLPAVGPVSLRGLTRHQARELIRTRLVEAKVYSAPQVVLNVTESRQPAGVAVMGAVKRAVMIPFRDDLNLLEAIAIAGGLIESEGFARPLLVVRDPLGKPTVFKFDVADAIENSQPVPRLLPGDVVIAQGSTYSDIERILNAASKAAISISQPVSTVKDLE